MNNVPKLRSSFLPFCPRFRVKMFYFCVVFFKFKFIDYVLRADWAPDM